VLPLLLFTIFSAAVVTVAVVTAAAAAAAAEAITVHTLIITLCKAARVRCARRALEQVAG